MTTESLKRDRNVVIQTLKALRVNHEAKRLSTDAFLRMEQSMTRELRLIDEVLGMREEADCE